VAHTELRLDDRWFQDQLGRTIAELRRLVGWDQRELAERAGTSQSTISRLETGASAVVDTIVVNRVLLALGARARIEIEAPHLRDRTRQRDRVHARLTQFVATRLERSGWRVATEVPIGEPVPRGWIDLLAYRPIDGAGLIGEVKGDLPDVGELQRQVGFYASAAPWAARALGWRFERTVTFVAALDSDAVRARISFNRELLARSLPGRATELRAWIESTAGPPPRGPTIVLVDPASRRASWVRPVRRPDVRPLAPYRDYTDAARRLAGMRR